MSAGIDLQYVDAEVRAQDDLFRHVNGRWLQTAEIAADRSIAGAFVTLRDAAEAAVRAILEDAVSGSAPADADERKIGDLYRNFMDEQRREALGVQPIQSELDAVAAVNDVAGFISLAAQAMRRGVTGPFAVYVIADYEDPDRYICYLEQDGLGLPDESYYREETFADIVSAYQRHIEAMFTLAGISDAAARAASVLGLERDLAAGHWDVVTCRDPQKTYNLVAGDALAALLPHWTAWTAGLDAPAGAFAEAVVRQPTYLEKLAGALSADRLPDWQNWLRWQIIRAAAPYLTKAFAAERFEFTGRTLSGTPVDRDLWKRGVEFVEQAMGEAIGRIYVARHFPPEAKARMDELVANLIEAYRVDIDALSWMSPETKAKALDKLARFTPKIGYPDTWRDYRALAVDPDDLVGNAARACAFELDYQLAKIGGPIDRGEWHMTPQTVNAYYMPTANEIVFPAAILQPPFFGVDADDAVNYGGIGAVIGHEIGHGFDDKGSQFDGTGALRNWWTDADRAAFDALTARLVGQYSALEPAETPGHHVNGELTLGENIGDLGGLTIAYKAYQLALAGADAPVLDGLTGAQRLFFSWATIWRSKIRPEEAVKRLTVDPHSPAQFRCNAVVRNLDEFYAAFAVTDADALWLAPEERVRIW